VVTGLCFEWPPAELAELHQSFLDMRRHASAKDRCERAFAVVVHPASRQRLLAACPRVLKRFAAHASLADDLLNQATLVLVAWLAADALKYEDHGADCFGGWYWRLCRRACRRAWRVCRPLWSREVLSFTEHEYAEFAAPREPPDAGLWLTQAIDAIPDARLRGVLLDWSRGMSLDESAAQHGVSSRTVRRLRSSGRQLLRRACAAAADDQVATASFRVLSSAH